MTDRKTYIALETELLSVLNARNWKGQAKTKAETFKDILGELKTSYGLSISTEFLIKLCESSGIDRKKASQKIADFVHGQELNLIQEVEISQLIRQRTGHVYGEENGVTGFNISEHQSVKALHFFN